MTYYAITAQYPIFTGLDGLPLENGYIYIGAEGGNPITDPVSAYWDDGLLYPVAQPVRTLAGAPNRNGSPAPIFVPVNFSILIQDKNQNQIYYSSGGIKNYTDNSLALRRNQIINGRFEIFHQITAPDRWQTSSTTYTLTATPAAADYELFSLATSPLNYIRLASSGGSAVADYSRYSTVLEDVTAYNGEVVTLSFLARTQTSTDQIAVSLEAFDDVAGSIATGIGATKFTLTGSFVRYSVTFQMPSLSQTTYESLSLQNLTGTAIHFWLGAGSNYDAQTVTLGNQDITIDIADVRFNRGGIVDLSDRRTYAEELSLCERYLETSYDINISGFGKVTDKGALFYAAPDAAVDIPGPRFKTVKRTLPTITLYSPATGTADVINHIGTGDEAATAYHINEQGVYIVELDVASLVDQDLYKYHFVANSEFTLP
jgi:hypothetical protein